MLSALVYNSGLRFFFQSESVNEENVEWENEELAYSVPLHVVEEPVQLVLFLKVSDHVLVNECHLQCSDEEEKEKSFPEIYPVKEPILRSSPSVVSH